METKQDLEQLKNLANNTAIKGRGARLRRMLLTLAIPATAALATACYGAPMAQDPYGTTPQSTVQPTVYPDGADCDGDGILESPSAEDCQ